MPDCLQSLQHKASVLAVATDGHQRLYCAFGSNIEAWDLERLEPLANMTAPHGSILALKATQDLLFSSAANTVVVWGVQNFEALFVIHAPHRNIGDVFALSYVAPWHTLFLGSQDASISSIRIPTRTATQKTRKNNPYVVSGQSTPLQIPTNYHKFFDSRSRKELVASLEQLSRSRSNDSDASLSPSQTLPLLEPAGDHPGAPEFLALHPSRVATYAHYGYVYSLAVAQREDKHILISGSGDGTIKLWNLNESVFSASHDEGPNGIEHWQTLYGSDDAAVYSVLYQDNTIFSALQGGTVKVFDFDTLQCIRRLNAHSSDVLSLAASERLFFSCSADGMVKAWKKNNFQLADVWKAHTGIAHTCCIYGIPSTEGRSLFITGGSDKRVKIWAMQEYTSTDSNTTGLQSEMLQLLGEFVRFKTISSDESCRESCRQGALYLKRVLRDLGAQASLLAGLEGRNPIVMAVFRASSHTARKRVLYYGHYDVVSAGQENAWKSDPFTLSGRDGYLYGRGTTDNKGCTLAVACAAARLKKENKLDVDLVMLIEGEEEQGSHGFREAVASNLSDIGPIDVILVSNSYWLGDSVPCVRLPKNTAARLTIAQLNYALRGVLHATITLTAGRKDLHSGQYGGLVSEPLFDLTRLISTLHDESGRCTIKGFHDAVAKVSAEEDQLFADVISRVDGDSIRLKLDKDTLRRAWREPTCNLHLIDGSGSASSGQAVLPSKATASLSLRIVPNQSIQSIGDALTLHLKTAYETMGGKDQLDVDIRRTADWWLGDRSSTYSQALFNSVRDEWQIEPLWICEGGSIPCIPWLQDILKAPACHFPMGQYSDAAHLPNERSESRNLLALWLDSPVAQVRLVNLERGQNIIYKWLQAIAKDP